MTMTVKALREALALVPDQSSPVYLSADEEGNHFGALDEASLEDNYVSGALILFPAGTVEADDLESAVAEVRQAAPPATTPPLAA